MYLYFYFLHLLSVQVGGYLFTYTGEDSLASQDYSEAFRASHTIKGVCQNLAFNKLGNSSDQLTESLRGGWTDAAAGLVEQVRADYQQTINALRQLDAE